MQLFLRSDSWRQIQRVVHTWARLAKSAAAGYTILSDRFGMVQAVRDSEAIFSDLIVPGKIEEPVSEFFISLLASHLNRSGDGGKTLILTIACLLETIPIHLYDFSGQGLLHEIDRLRDQTIDSLPKIYKSSTTDLLDFLKIELSDLPPEFLSFLESYFTSAGEYTHLYINDSKVLDSTFRHTGGYEFKVQTLPQEFNSSKFIRFDPCHLAIFRGRIDSADDLKYLFPNSPFRTVLICRPGTYPVEEFILKNNGKVMIFFVSDDYVFDDLEAAFSLPSIFYLSQQNLRTAFVDGVEYHNSRLVVTGDFHGMTEEYLSTIVPDLYRPQNKKRLAMLSGDLAEIGIGRKYSDSESFYISRRLHFVTKAASRFRYGSTVPYHFAIRQALSSLNIPTMPAAIRKYFMDLNEVTPHPAGIDANILKSAWSAVRLLLSIDPLLI